MNRSSLLFVPLFALSCVSMPLMTGCASTKTQASLGETIDDSWITTKVKGAFVEDKTVKAMDVQVETFKGTVQLSGFASSSNEINRAVELARSIKGVKAVKNDIRLKANQ